MKTQICPSCATDVALSNPCCRNCGWQFPAPAGCQGVTRASSAPIVRAGLHRPDWICGNVWQNVCLVRDCSSSMSGNKARDAERASSDLVTELAQPANKDAFSIAVVDFGCEAAVVHELTKATALAGNVHSLDVGVLGGSTNITAGLRSAQGVLDDSGQPDGVRMLRPVVLLFSDGGHNEGTVPKGVAGRLKKTCDLVTVAFGADADECLLTQLASTPEHFYRCRNGGELRSFLATVGKTMTQTRACGANATQALSQLR